MKKAILFLAAGLATGALPCRGDEKAHLAYAPIPKAREWKLPEPPTCPGTGAWYVEQVKKVGEAKLDELTDSDMSSMREEEADRIAGLLDRHYRRCPLKTLELMFAQLGYFAKEPKFWEQNRVFGLKGRQLKGSKEATYSWRVWRITSDVYFTLTCDDGAYCIRDQFYRLIFYDGKTARVADSFAIPPTVGQVSAILQARRNPDALNNAAAKLADPDGTLFEFSDSRVETLLRHAAMGGSVVACENMVRWGKAKKWPEKVLAKWRKTAKRMRDPARRAEMRGFRMGIPDWPLD